MDDLERLRELRADAPEPGADRLATVRAHLLRDAAGARRVRRARPRLLGPMAVAAVAVAVITAGAVAVRMAGDPAPGPRAPSGTALNTAAVLENAARVAERRPAAKLPGPKQWQYIKPLTKQSGGEMDTQEEWIRVDGRRTAWYPTEYVDEDDRLRTNPPGTLVIRSTTPIEPDDDDLPPAGYAEKLRELPTDPAALLKHVLGDRHWIDLPKEDVDGPAGKEPPADRAFRVLGLYLGEQAVMPPRLEAAIYRAIGRIPGVETREGVADAAGRRGISVSRAMNDETRWHYILEPGTYRYLGRMDVATKDSPFGGPFAGPEPITSEGEMLISSALLAAKIVDGPGDRS